MYNELIKNLREFASLPEHCENIADCDKCTKEEICISFTNKRIAEVATQAADAIEKLAEGRQWISVTEAERLPDEKTPVLILADTIAGKDALTMDGSINATMITAGTLSECLDHNKWSTMKRTRGDCIRSKTDEELAEWLGNMIFPECVCCPADNDGWCKDCKTKWIEWLKKEAE